MKLKMTQADQLLLAAKELMARGETPFTKQSLVIIAWTKWPQDFGMEGHLDHPDTHRAYCSLMGKRGMVGIGLLKNNQGLYQLTPLGLQRVEQISLNMGNMELRNTNKSRDKVILDENDQQLLLRLLADPAHTKVKVGQRLEVPAKEGLGFWAINGDIGGEVSAKVNRVACALKWLTSQMGPGDDLVFDNGLSVSWDDVSSLTQTEQWLTNRFMHHIKLLERRKQ